MKAIAFSKAIALLIGSTLTLTNHMPAYDTSIVNNQAIEDEEEQSYHSIIRADANVNIRKNTSTDSDIVGILSEGCKLDKAGELKNYYMVEFNGNYRFVSKDYTHEEQEEIIKSDINKLVYVAKETPIFDENNLSLEIDYLPKYECLEVYGEAYGFYYGKTNDYIGLVKKSDCIDLPNDVIVVDISDQEVKYYEDNIVKIDARCVSGKPGHDTSIGYFEIFEKSHDRYLVGPTWKSWVSYMLKFNGGQGLHDAEYHTDEDGRKHGWRDSSEFGGSTYLSNGSHGCVNMKYDDVAELYNSVNVGTKVLVKK